MYETRWTAKMLASALANHVGSSNITSGLTKITAFLKSMSFTRHWLTAGSVGPGPTVADKDTHGNVTYVRTYMAWHSHEMHSL